MKPLSFLLIGMSALFCAGCASPSAGTQKPSVVASIYPLGFVAERIAGPDASVQVVTPLGAEPHEFEPTPSQISAAISADILLWDGASIDTWASKLAENNPSQAKRTDIKVIKVLAPLLSVEESPREVWDDGVYGIDPHFWLDPQRMVKLATVVSSALGQVDPPHAKDYAERAAALIVELQSLDEDFTNGLQECRTHDIIVAHQAFQYLAKRYALTIHAIAGISPEQEGSPTNVVEIQNLAKQLGIRDIFAENAAVSPAVESLAKDLGGTVLVLNPVESLTADQKAANADYIQIMRQNLSTLRSSLQCR